MKEWLEIIVTGVLTLLFFIVARVTDSWAAIGYFVFMMISAIALLLASLWKVVQHYYPWSFSGWQRLLIFLCILALSASVFIAVLRS